MLLPQTKSEKQKKQFTISSSTKACMQKSNCLLSLSSFYNFFLYFLCVGKKNRLCSSMDQHLLSDGSDYSELALLEYHENCSQALFSRLIFLFMGPENIRNLNKFKKLYKVRCQIYIEVSSIYSFCLELLFFFFSYSLSLFVPELLTGAFGFSNSSKTCILSVTCHRLLTHGYVT